MNLTLELRVAVRCHACSVLTPMVGIRNKMSCRNCAAAIDFENEAKDSRDGGVRYPFGGYYDAVAEAALVLQDGEECQDARDSQGSPVALAKIAGPQCLSCAHPLPVPAAGATSVRCAGCDDVVGVRWPDDETRTWDPRIWCIVGDGLKASHETREARSQGALVSCGQCGAPLTGDQTDRRRARTCAHCTAVNFLGDAAMLALFPQPEWHRSFLLYQLDDRAVSSLYDMMLGEDNHYFVEDEQEEVLGKAQTAARAAARGAVVAAAAKGEATPAELDQLLTDASLTAAEAAQLDAWLDDSARIRICKRPAAAAPLIACWASASSDVVRLHVAAHPACKGEQLIALAGDANASVRVIAAGRSELPADLLAKLRKDPDKNVVGAVKANPSYKPGFFEKLLG